MQKKILEDVTKIFEESLFRDLSSCKEPMKENIFGNNIALLPAEAYFLMVKLEKHFDISFPDDVIFDYKFQSIGEIVGEIEKCLHEKDK